jgi:rhamnosyltransferase
MTILGFDRGSTTRDISGFKLNEQANRGAPARETICAVIVTHNPDDDLYSRIQKVRPQVANIALVDNGSTDSNVSRLQQLAPNVHIILNPRNEGVARALNQGAHWAAQQGYRWILSLDQDSVVVSHMVDSLALAYHAFPEHNSLAVIGSNYTSVANGKPGAANRDENNSWGAEVKTVITSGSLVSLRAFQEIGGFREEFFVDCVDLEYCLRARSRGFHVVMTSEALMQHSIGNLTEHRLPWRTTGASNHSPWRQYFMTRNTLILAREYLGSEPRWVLETLWSRMKSLTLICLFEKQRLSKLAYSSLGVFDALRGKVTSSPLGLVGASFREK